MLDDIVGHKSVIEMLCQIGTDVGGCLFVFHGPHGIGKSILAKKWVEWLKVSEIMEVCLSPTQAYYSVDEIDQLVQYSSVMPNQQDVRLDPGTLMLRANIIYTGNQVKETSYNSMLKMLEDISKRQLFIIIVSDLSYVPDTVLSRSIKVPFKALEYHEISLILSKDKIKMPIIYPYGQSVVMYKLFSRGLSALVTNVTRHLSSAKVFIQWLDLLDKFLTPYYENLSLIKKTELFLDVIYEILFFLMQDLLKVNIFHKQPYGSLHEMYFSFSDLVLVLEHHIINEQIGSIKSALEYLFEPLINHRV